MSVSTSAAFFDLLKESDVLSAEELTRAENLVGDETDTRNAARRLVKADLLTRWQASQLLKGSPLLSLGKYVLLERLPWGSNHAVFLATHPMMDRKVALNVLDRASSGRADSRDSFISDARAIAALDHRHLIHVYDIDEADDRCFLVMEYVDGNNLHNTVKKRGPMSVEVAANLIRQIADGLSHAHERKLIHGGLRPTNVILDDEGTATVIDLGLSKFDDLSQKPAGKEDDSKILSIADFISPEQASGKLPTPATDIYSLGCIAYFMLAGQAPFTGGSYTQRLQRHQHDQAPDIRKARKEIPVGLAAIVAKMMAKEAGDRYAAASEIVKDLEKWWAEYSATMAANKPKPAPAKPAADTKPRPTAARPTSSAPTPSKPPQAAAPPPKKNGQPAPAESAKSTEPAGFPGITTGKPKKKPQPSAAAPAVKPSPAPSAPTKAKKSKASPAGPDAKTTATKAVPKSASTEDGAEETKKKGLPLPLILGGAGALLLLLLLGGGGLTAYFLLSSSDDGDTNIAVAEPEVDENTDPDAETPAADADNPTKGTETEPATEPNDPAAGDPELPAPGDVPPEGEEPDDGSGSEPDNENPENNEPQDGDPAGGEPDDGSEKPPTDPEPPKDPPKPKDGDKPKPNGGNKKPPTENPPKAQKPFREIAAAIELPPISGEAQPASLGKIHLPEDTAVYIDLLGGDRIAPKEKGVFALDRARNGLADREWEFKFDDGGDSATIVATMKLEGNDLQFQWTPEAAEQDAAPYLCNCALNLRTSDDETYLALRKPQQISGLPVNLEKPLLRERFEIAQAPDLETLAFEITSVEGVEKVSYVPKQALEVARDNTIVWFGEGENRLLGFKFDTVMQKELQVTMTAVVDGGGQPLAFNGRQLASTYSQALAMSQQLNSQVQQMKKKKEQYKKQLPVAEQQLSLATQTIEKLDKLKEQIEKVNGKATVHFRVYRTAGDHKIDILQGTLAPEQEAKRAG